MNWFKYRLPNSKDIVSGASKTLTEGLGKGFVVAPFLNPNALLLTIPFEFSPDSNDLTAINSSLPNTTSKSDYYREILAIKDDLKSKRGKTVAARVIKLDLSIDINATFDALSSAYPDAFVFAFSTSKTGTWIGATPELLLKKDGHSILTMALAGTREVSDGEKNFDWDEKNTDEQKMVVEFIKETLEKNCQNVNIFPNFTKKAGNIEHICSPIKADLINFSDEHLCSLLCQLSPTPALCGNDRNRSLQLIADFEKFNREFYGGFCGPCNINGDSIFYVILRSAKCSDDSIAIFAGGGITPLSNPDDEWNETELKSKTIINKLKMSKE